MRVGTWFVKSIASMQLQTNNLWFQGFNIQLTYYATDAQFWEVTYLPHQSKMCLPFFSFQMMNHP